MEYRKAIDADFDQLVLLQNENLVTNLPEDQRQDGFLSGGFTADQFRKFNEDLAVVLATESNCVCAYLVTSSVAANLNYPLPAAMIARYDQAMFDGKPLNFYHSLVAGPVCVGKEHRGKGIFEGLYAALPSMVPSQYELAVAFVSIANARSLRAHEKVGMQRCDQFAFDGREFITIARLL